MKKLWVSLASSQDVKKGYKTKLCRMEGLRGENPAIKMSAHATSCISLDFELPGGDSEANTQEAQRYNSDRNEQPMLRLASRLTSNHPVENLKLTCKRCNGTMEALARHESQVQGRCAAWNGMRDGQPDGPAE